MGLYLGQAGKLLRRVDGPWTKADPGASIVSCIACYVCTCDISLLSACKTYARTIDPMWCPSGTLAMS